MSKEKKKREGTQSATGDPGFVAVWWVAPVFLAAISILYFHHFIVSDDILFGMDSGTDYHRGKESAIEKIGELDQAMWNPRLGGYPESEDLRWRYFPTYLLYLTTTWHRHIGWRYIVSVFVAGLGMFLYLRRGLGTGWLASLWGGVAYMSAPTFMSFIFAGHFAKMGVIALFPYMCLLLDKGMRSGGPRYFGGLAAIIGLAIYTPHLQMLYYALWGLGLYFLYRLYELYRASSPGAALVRCIGLFSAAVVLGLGLGSEGVWPSYTYSKGESKRAGGLQEKLPEEELAFARSWSLHPEEVGSLVLPHWGGFTDPQSGRNYYWGRNAMKLNSEYFGVAILLLALLPVTHLKQRTAAGADDARPSGEGEQRSTIIFMVGLGLFALAYALGPHTPIHWIMFHLVPGANVLRTPGMIAYLIAFPACVLATIGLDGLLRTPRLDQSTMDRSRQTGRRILQIGGILGALSLIVALAPASAGALWSSVVFPDITPDKRQVFDAGIAWLQRGALITVLVVAGATALLFMGARGRLQAIVVVAGLGALTVADAWRINRLFMRYENPKLSPDMRRENRGTAAFLTGAEDGPRRILPLPNYSLLRQPGYRLYGVPSVTGFHDFTVRRYDHLLRQFEPVVNALGQKLQHPDSITHSQEQLIRAIEPLLNAIGVHYIVTPRGLSLKVPGFPEVYAEESLHVYRNDGALPWVLTVADAVVMENEANVVSALRAGAFDLRQTVILEQQPPAAMDTGQSGSGVQSAVELRRYAPADGAIDLAVDADGPHMLVVSENYHSNWTATVDGVESPLFRANFVWQAVFVPGGRHVVEFRYRSSIVELSRWLSLLSAIVIVVVIVFDTRRARRARIEADPAA